MAGAHRALPGLPPSRAPDFRCVADADRHPVFRRDAAPRVRRGLGAAVHRGAQYAAGARIGARCSRAYCAPRSPRPRATATSSCRPSTCPRAFPDAAARIRRRRAAARSAAASPCAAIARRRRRGARRSDGSRESASPRPSSPSARISSHATRRRRSGRTSPRGAPRSAQVAAFAYESITTIYLAFAGRGALRRADAAPRRRARPVGVRPQRRCRSGRAGRGARACVAVVISGGGPHDALDQATLAREVDAQLRRLAPDLPPRRPGRA